MKNATALPDVATWPHTTCRICGGSKINGLFTPGELKNPSGPRCMKCIGEVNTSNRRARHSGIATL
jgi:hypothetical protein